MKLALENERSGGRTSVRSHRSMKALSEHSRLNEHRSAPVSSFKEFVHLTLANTDKMLAAEVGNVTRASFGFSKLKDGLGPDSLALDKVAFFLGITQA